jgi:hypothetical protein
MLIDVRFCVYGCGLTSTKLQNTRNHAAFFVGYFKSKKKDTKNTPFYLTLCAFVSFVRILSFLKF